MIIPLIIRGRCAFTIMRKEILEQLGHSLTNWEVLYHHLWSNLLSWTASKRKCSCYVQEEGYFAYLQLPMNSYSIDKKRMDLYSQYHEDFGHDTEDFFRLKNNIKKLITSRHLKRFLHKPQYDKGTNEDERIVTWRHLDGFALAKWKWSEGHRDVTRRRQGLTIVISLNNKSRGFVYPSRIREIFSLNIHLNFIYVEFHYFTWNFSIQIKCSST